MPYAPFLLSLLSGLLAWLGCALAIAHAADTPALPIVDLPSWSNVFATSPLAVITAILVRWLLKHIEDMRKEFIQVIEAKDKAFEALAERAYQRLETLAREVMDLVKQHGVNK